MDMLHVSENMDKENTEIELVTDLLQEDCKTLTAAVKTNAEVFNRCAAQKHAPFHERTNCLNSCSNAMKNKSIIAVGVNETISKGRQLLLENEHFIEGAVARGQKVHVSDKTKARTTKNLNAMQEDISINKNDYTLDASTSLNVSDILSPTSAVDVQLPNISIESAAATNTFSKQLNDKVVKVNTTPLNDRQRFFEVVEYQADILEHFREIEKKRQPAVNFMNRQPYLTYSMRMSLIDWLINVSEEQHLDAETIHLCVSFIDRFLSETIVSPHKLQLLGIAALFVASKYEEIYFPSVRELVFLTDSRCTKAQVLRMERTILKTLQFELLTPTTYTILNTYAVVCDIPNRLKYLAQYICELTLLKPDTFARYYPSMLTAAAMALAAYGLGFVVWSEQLTEITTYQLEDLRELVLDLSRIHNAAKRWSQRSIQTKYAAVKYDQVSSIRLVTLNAVRLDAIIYNYRKEQKQRLTKPNQIRNQRS